jgi:hypothetical protein
VLQEPKLALRFRGGLGRFVEQKGAAGRYSMNVDEFELERETSAPIDMLEHYFTAHGWACERSGDDEIVANFQGSWTQYELRAIWREEDHVLQFLALPDVRVANDKRAAVYETIGLINEQLWLGHFELWSASGLVLFRHAALIESDEGGVLTLQQAETLVEAAIEECERFYPVFQFVLWADKTPQEAIAAALIETQGEA